MNRFAAFLLVTSTNALRRRPSCLRTTTVLRGGAGRWRGVTGGAGDLRSTASYWADYLMRANATAARNGTASRWKKPKPKKKAPSDASTLEGQAEIAEAFAAAGSIVTPKFYLKVCTTVVPCCGAVLANGMFLASWPAVAAARQSGALGSLNPLPFAFTFINCVGWLHYGFVMRNHYVFWSNALGSVLGLLYTTTALKLGCPQIVEYITVGGLAIHVVSAYVTGLRLESLSQRKLCAGLVANFILLCYYAAPLSTVASVIKARDASSISGPLVMVNAGNGLLWTVYGAAVEDALVWAPNLAGVALAAAQLALKVVFRGPASAAAEGAG